MNQSTLDSFLQRRTPTGGERFLFPMLKYGPNNQFLCLMQCAKLAKDTHRTLVLPVLSLRPFTMHLTSGSCSTASCTTNARWLGTR